MMMMIFLYNFKELYKKRLYKKENTEKTDDRRCSLYGRLLVANLPFKNKYG